MAMDPLKEQVVFCFWTEANAMSEDRAKCLESMQQNMGCTVKLIQHNDIEQYLTADHPLHPAYSFLSATHKADYLRCYFLHHYGGGYCDIKQVSHDWTNYFQQLIESDKFLIGYKEACAEDIAILPGEKGQALKDNWFKLCGNGAYICKPRTALTSKWYQQLHQALDEYLPKLEKHPAKYPQDQAGVLYNGTPSLYPIPWAGILGNILHPLMLEFADKLLQNLPAPSFQGYR